MIRLAIDASTPVCCVGLILDSNKNTFLRWEKGQGVHSQRLFEQINEVLSEAGITLNQVDEFVISSGPGSYTGLRIAASALKGILFSTSKEITGVQTLAYFTSAILEKHPEAKRIHAVLDARRTHLYHQVFEFENAEIKTYNELKIRDLSEINSMIQTNDFFGGTGFERLDLTRLKELNCTLVDERDSINPIQLALFSTKNELWKTFYSKVTPALFEPNYYTYGQAQVQKPATPKTK